MSSSLQLPRRWRRYGLLALGAIGGYILHRRGGGHRTAALPAELPEAARRFVRLLEDRGSTVVAIRRGEGDHGWIVEWEHGRSLCFPDER